MRRNDDANMVANLDDDPNGLWCLMVPQCSRERTAHRHPQTPNPLNAGIQKSLEQQVGADPNGGDINTPDTSRFIIARDPFRYTAGRQLFQRKFTVAQGLDRASVMG